MVVGEREALQPGAASPVGPEDGPNAAALITAIGEPDTQRDARGVWFLPHRELETPGASFEFGGSNPARHRRQMSQCRCPVCVPRMGEQRERPLSRNIKGICRTSRG